jgi:hypothetical protein
MLLLQVDCLAHVEERGDADVPDGTQEATDLVIGAGVPQEWMDRPISVRGIRTRAGRVDWSWDGSSLHVTLRGDRCRVRAGPGFGSGVSPRVEHLPWD